MGRFWLVAVAAVVWGGVAKAAATETTATARRATVPSYSLSIEALSGYSVNYFYRTGFGARAAVNFRGGVFLGVVGMHHVGTTLDVSQGSGTSRAWFLGAETGYNIRLLPALTFRPSVIGGYLGVGTYGTSFEALMEAEKMGLKTAPADAFLLAPGAGLVVRVADPIYLGAELRANIATRLSGWAGYASVGAEL